MFRQSLPSTVGLIMLVLPGLEQPATAQIEQPVVPPQFITAVDLEFLTAFAEARGHKVEQSVNRLNEAVVVASTQTELRYALVGMNCEPPDSKNCSGIQMMMILAPMGGPDLEEVNVLNYNRAAVSVWRSPTDPDLEAPPPPEFGVNRYVILDYGITKQNLDVNMGVFLQAAQSVKDAIER
ncbi:MAG: hypothetical protein AAFR41_09540 [Pseudomonadota bacterium]